MAGRFGCPLFRYVKIPTFNSSIVVFFGPMYKQNGVEVSRVPTDLVNTHENCCGKTKALHTFLLFGNHRVGV